ncbi:MAG: FAD-dependent monooxygenase [Aeromicrobium sp.]|uniref:FAD binding domain-containing protein n=1 Tax=Aeromicrobium sp. TaxID=1871063 RepID=UPI002632972C|nr:FAD-dependent monooxygenase [Aeromicrobium sp.]MDF1704892.1 FAD-dependent monooxygenase [Aeromicrobium sp.]
MGKFGGQRAIVLGGSIGGLTTGLLLKDLGFEVTVFERTPTELDGRGGGIVLQPDTLRWFRERSQRRPEEVSTVTQQLRYLGRDDEIVFEEPVEWRYSSWSVMYRSLLADLGRENYELGEFACGFSQDADGVDVRFVGGRVERADLVVFADGITSVGRRRLDPAAVPTYAGYVGWRGTVLESEVSPAVAELLGSSLTYSVAENTHICMYPIPGPDESLDVGRRLLNYVWYRNVAEGAELDELLTDKRGFQGPVSVHPGQVQDRYVAEMKAAASATLAPAAAELVNRTEQPYIQPILDVRSQHMAVGRVAVIGDAAFAARPHGAAGTAKAAADAWALAGALEVSDSIETALQKWEPGQLQIGNNIIDRVSRMGARSQFENTWVPGDPDLRFGLYGPGI